LFGEVWCTPPIRQKARIATTASASTRCQPAVTFRCKVGNNSTLKVFDDGANRHRNGKVSAALSVRFFAASMGSIVGSPERMVTKAEQ
jgi:hypothetical protein